MQPTRPPHMRQVIRNPSAQLRPGHPNGPPVGINVVPPHITIRPPSSAAIQQQQQHHMQSLPTAAAAAAVHHSGPPQQITPYIPPHQRDTNRLNHHVQQRINSQMHQSNKNRSHVNMVSGSGLPNTIQQQQQHQQQQQQAQPQNIPASSTVLYKRQQMLKSNVHQQQQLQSSSHSQSHNSHQQQQQQQQQLCASRQKHHSQQQQSSSSSSDHHQTPSTLSQHNVQSMQPKAILTQKSNMQQQHQQQQHQNSSHLIQTTNTQQQQNSTTILQKNPHQQHQYKILKPQSQQNANNCNGSGGGGGGVDGGGTTNCNNVTQQQQSSTVQSNHLTSKSQTSQTMTNTSSENISYSSDTQTDLDITPPQQQQHQKEKNNQITDLVNCSNNIQQQQQQIQNSLIKSNEITLANSKEKTPMCLVNELVRFNKIQHQYRLTGEQGPAHSKRFTVTLELGDEEYSADGPSIKKAQHSAAAEAVLKTKYTHPPMKTSRSKRGGDRNGVGNITPTVELNALAMKLGKSTLYVFDSPLPPSQPSQGTTTASLQTSSLPPMQQQQQQQTIHQQHSHPHCGNIITSGTPIGTATFVPTHINETIKSSSNQQNHYSMHVPPNHVYYQDGYHHYQPNTKNNSMNVHHPPVSQHSGLPPRRSHSVRGVYHRQNSHTKVSSYNGGTISSAASKSLYRITLTVGTQKFTGIGPTPQAAKHDAAARALRVLKPLSMSSEESSGELNSTTTTTGTGTTISILSSSSANTDPNSDIKSPISLVHEVALQRNLSVTFEVKSEKGPPHMKIFITMCKVGNIVTEGEGNGKKISKRRAAEKMLDELNKLPPLCSFKNSHNSTTSQMRVRNLKRRTTKNIIKDSSKSDTSTDDVNPISKLIQIQQSLKEREPIYTVIEEKGAPRRKEFVIEVSAGGHVARGTGSNKKLAKKIAAKNLLTLLGYDNDSTSSNEEDNTKIENKMESISKNNNNNNNRVNANKNKPTAITTTTMTSKSQINTKQNENIMRQIVPGLLIMQRTLMNPTGLNSPVQSTKSSKVSNTLVNNKTDTSYGSTIETKNDNVNGSKVSDNTNTIVTNNNNNNNNTNNNNNNNNNTINCDVVRPKDQLMYLADLLGFQVVFSDYPKGNHGEYLTIVTLSTDPPQICHGAGCDTNVSQDKAATTALQMLSNLGLDNVKPKRSSSSSTKNPNDIDENKKLSTTVGASSNE